MHQIVDTCLAINNLFYMKCNHFSMLIFIYLMYRCSAKNVPTLKYGRYNSIILIRRRAMHTYSINISAGNGHIAHQVTILCIVSISF